MIPKSLSVLAGFTPIVLGATGHRDVAASDYGILKKAIRLAHKAEFGREKQDHETLETILETVGKTL